MSDSHWINHPAVGGLIAATLGACLFMAGLNYQPNKTSSDEQTPRYVGEESAHARPIPAPPANQEPDRNEWRNEKDLQAQRDMAKWTFWIFVVSAVGAVITGVGVVFVRETLVHTREANDINRRAFEEAERPLFFVSVSDPEWKRTTPGVDPYTGELIPPDEVDWSIRDVAQHIEFHNVGTRGAFVRKFHSAIGFPGYFKEQTEFGGLAEIAPDDKPHHFVAFVCEDPPINELMSAGYELAIWGAMTYEDALGIVRERGFKFIAKQPTGLAAALAPNQLIWERVNDPNANYDRRIGEKQK